MVEITDIPDFPNQPGQKPEPGAPSGVEPVAVVLVSAPLDREYRNIALNSAAVDAYIAAETVAGRSYSTTVERWSPWSMLQLELDMADAAAYNYGRFTVGGRSWYAFLDVGYLNLTTTAYMVTPDEWTTYSPTLGYSEIARGHIAVAASQSDTYGSEYLLAPEPIDALPVDGILSEDIGASAVSEWTVLVISSTDLRAAPFQAHAEQSFIADAKMYATDATADHTGNPQILFADADYPWSVTSGSDVLVSVPYSTPSPQSTIDGVAAGGGVYKFTLAGFAQYMSIMQGASWITAGISAVRLVPSWSIGGGGDAAFTAPVPPETVDSGLWAQASAIPVFAASVTTGSEAGTALSSWRDSVLSSFDAAVYRKLITSQFCQILMMSGDTALPFAPEAWQSPGVSWNLFTGAAHGDNSLRLIPSGYNAQGAYLGVSAATGGNAGKSLTGYGIAAAQVGNQDMSPGLNGYAAKTSWDQANSNKNLAIAIGVEKTAVSLGVQIIQSTLGSLQGAVQGGLEGVAAGPEGAAAGALSGASSGGGGGLTGMITTAISAANSVFLLDVSNNQAFDYAMLAQGMSGQGSLLGFDAWAQSLHAVPGVGTPESRTAAWRALADHAFRVVITVPVADRVQALLTMWKRYGYMIGRPMVPPRLDVMTHYSYWQTHEATIIGAIPQASRDRIATAFDRGVTVWGSVAEIGSQPSNAPVAGISY